MRGIMIGAGAALITRFSWIIYVFGGFLILTGVKMLLLSDGERRRQRQPPGAHDPPDHPHHPALPRPPVLRPRRLARPRPRRRPAAPTSPTAVAAAAKKGALLATPLFLALLLVEFTDVIFAVDSIPAIFAITTDPFIVFTSNVFAILGLRSLYFALAGMMDRFRYLKHGPRRRPRSCCGDRHGRHHLVS
jgi:tellurite resistance protein TerC